MKRAIDYIKHDTKEFRIVGFEAGSFFDETFNLDMEFDEEDTFEWIYTFIQCEYFNLINTLEIGETMHIKLSRDWAPDKAVIIRTK